MMKKYRVVDLFSGCGGISKGFQDTGKVEIVGAIDFDTSACDTYRNNFPSASVICKDIRDVPVQSTGFSQIDIMVGGPPCQGFSALNQWDKEKDQDPRNRLFIEYLRFVDELRPKAIMIENVKQILTAKNGYAPKHITAFLEKRGYNVSYKILNAADYGVPQKRERAIIVALRKEYGVFDFDIMEKYKLPKVTVKLLLNVDRCGFIFPREYDIAPNEITCDLLLQKGMVDGPDRHYVQWQVDTSNQDDIFSKILSV